MTTSKAALSDDWRIKSSTNQPIDMANALRSIRKVIAAIDTRNCEVSFNRDEQSHFDHHDKENLLIRIDPRFALKNAPIQGHDFDVLAGLSVHEALHSSCLSDSVRKVGTDAYQNICQLGEEIYIDNFGKRNFPVLGKYIHLAREAYKPEPEQVPWDNLYSTWTAIAVFGIMPLGTWMDETKKIAQLQLLMELSSLMMGKDVSPPERQVLYEETAKRLEAMITKEEIEAKLNQNKANEPPLELEAPKGLVQIPMNEKVEEDDNAEDDDASGDSEEAQEDSTKGEEEGGGGGEKDDGEVGEDAAPVQPTGSSEGEDIEDEPGDGQDAADSNETDTALDEEKGNSNTPLEPVTMQGLLHPATTELSSDMANSIAEVLELGIEDMSEQVKQTFGISTPRAIVWSKAKTDIDNDFNKDLARQLVWVKDYKNTRGHQTYRNEQRGTLDAQRIYKAPINGLIFKRRVELPRSDLDLVMLLDASSSMTRNTSIYEDAKALHQTLPDSTVLSYTSRVDMELIEHTDGRAFRAVIPRGGTPTAEAIAATALRFPNSLIIHFTDGECDRDELEELFPKIHVQFPKLRMVHIMLRENNHYRNRYSQQDEGIPEFDDLSKTVIMDKVEDFPGKLKEILKEW